MVYKCSGALFPIIDFCSGVYFGYWPLFLLFLTITERTSELAAAIEVDGTDCDNGCGTLHLINFH